LVLLAWHMAAFLQCINHEQNPKQVIPLSGRFSVLGST